MRAAPFLAVLAASLLIATAVSWWAPFPAAVVARGTEEPFAVGLHPRELPPGGAPLRWTTERARFRFVSLPSGPARLEVALHGHRESVGVAANGVALGVIERGENSGTFALPEVPGRVEVELRTPGFRAGDGRLLGALLDRVSVDHVRSPLPPMSLAFIFVVPACVLFAAAVHAAIAPIRAAILALVVSSMQALALAPSGIIRSPYGRTLALALILGALVAWTFARWCERSRPGSGPWAFVALLAAVLVQGVAGTSPIMVVSDAVFHANKLMAVTAGDFFPTSVTQHAPPFRIPYGVSFYALLVPFARAGGDPVGIVRLGGAAAGVAASAALFRLALPLGAVRAAVAVILLQLLPATFDVPYSHGNLSNGFGQAMTVLFFAWWAGSAPGGWRMGALALVLAALGHLSSLFVLIVLVAVLVVLRRNVILTDRTRWLALVVGLGVTALYYSRFVRLVALQLPRLLEGGGQGRGASRSGGDALWLQVVGLVAQWGLPAILLALAGSPRASRSGLERDMTAWWWAGAVLALAAVVSPLEVRYLYALTLPLAVAAASGASALWEGRASGPQHERLVLRGVVTLLLAAQATIAARGVAEAVLDRYRP